MSQNRPSLRNRESFRKIFRDLNTVNNWFLPVIFYNFLTALSIVRFTILINCVRGSCGNSISSIQRRWSCVRPVAMLISPREIYARSLLYRSTRLHVRWPGSRPGARCDDTLMIIAVGANDAAAITRSAITYMRLCDTSINSRRRNKIFSLLDHDWDFPFSALTGRASGLYNVWCWLVFFYLVSFFVSFWLRTSVARLGWFHVSLSAC